MGLHLAIREQVGTDRPPGIAQVHASLTRRLGDAHAAEHRMIECLAEELWQSQRDGRPPDETAYLAALKRAAGLAD
jgi:predicted RNA polymerase sigma factor